ncbi:Tat pathway signal protein [Marinobacter panjinensis]|uniref:Tat pathway signal protein n=1 Tax=Marinobacter panjinensis TaxID=2576384 RepID=A0A4U6R2R8_9GAMM|nr:nitroreductase family protein [Marinobacter panjinensis]MCR8913417.1 nitroreductase family protein [Marinobacter panjinensis]TKV67917.1 Tat pathway signal protein [Marinobacter panjinensis]
MNYSDYAKETWRHLALDNAAQDYSVLVHYATLAASSHNTQPWIFKLENNRIRILPDLSRRCPAVDPDDHHLYASLGCAAENLLLAAEAAGLKGHCSYDASTSGVNIDFEETTPFRSPLFEAIPQRQCSRVEYDGSQLSAEQLQQLEKAGQGDGVSIIVFTDGEQKEQVARYVAEGNTAQFGDSEWARELKSWIRFNGSEAVTKGDGLYGPVMGNPAVPRWLGLMAMHFGFSAKKQNQKDYRHIRSSSAIAVLVSEIDDKPHWIEAGRCYERLALQATALGLSTAFINQPVEVAPLRAEFARFLGVGNRRPDFVVRIGRGAEMPRSLRRPLEQVIK